MLATPGSDGTHASRFLRRPARNAFASETAIDPEVGIRGKDKWIGKDFRESNKTGIGDADRDVYEASTMTFFTITGGCQVFLCFRTHVARSVLYGSDKVGDQVIACEVCSGLGTCCNQASAGDFRFGQMGTSSFFFKFFGQTVGNTENQRLHGGSVLHSGRKRNTKAEELCSTSPRNTRHPPRPRSGAWSCA